MQNQIKNIINQDGEAIYFGDIFSFKEKANYFEMLFNNIDWSNEVVVMFGKELTIKRKVAFYADKGIEYTYSKKTKKGLMWNNILLELKQRTENLTNSSYNACLLNLYHDGSEGMGWHSDNEKEIIIESSIASLSFGAERKFSFKHKLTKETISAYLENGSLLEMKGKIQQNWMHAMPKTSKVNSPRINLTFRRMI